MPELENDGRDLALAVEELNVYRSTDGAPVVRNASFQVAKGEILAVVGESGSGKSSLGLALLGFCSPGLTMRADRLRVGREDIDLSSQPSVYAARQERISYVPQDPSASLNPALSVKSQLYERLPKSKDQRHEIVCELLESVDLPSDASFLRRRVGMLSGGQQQRVAIAMAAVTRPDVLILDEPTTGLDVSTQAMVLELVRRLCSDFAMGAVFITHDLAVVRHTADRVLVLYGGYDLEYGPTDHVLEEPAHPYTDALLRCVPDAHQKLELIGIRGRPPSLEQPEPGCPFAPRCEFALDECRNAVPGLQQTDGGGAVRCIRYGDIPVGRPRQVAEDQRRGPAEFEPKRSRDDSVFAVDGLRAWYGKSQVLFGLDMQVSRGECVAVVGQSGSGKTTASRCMIGLHHEFHGEVTFKGDTLDHKAAKRNAYERRSIQYIFQNPYGSLNPRFSVGSNLSSVIGLFGNLKRGARKNKSQELLERVGLPASVADSYPGQLSGGQKQRVAIARALACDPELIICDEITSALDVSVQASLLTLLQDLIDSGLSTIFVTHDLGVVRNISDRVYVMKGGEIVEEGATSRVIDRPEDSYTASLLEDTLSTQG